MIENKHGLSVGDRVRVREWDDMKAEFGLDEIGNINIRLGFTKNMAVFCGRVATVACVTGSRVYLNCEDRDVDFNRWLWSVDMLELDQPGVESFDESDFLKFIDREGGGIHE